MARTNKKETRRGTAAAKETRRGSPEAIAKRRAARSLNSIFEKGATASALDGRTLKKLRRMTKELQSGRNGKPLKAQEVLTRANELLAMGETLSSIRKLKPLVQPMPPLNDQLIAVFRETQAAYGYDPRAWKILGVDIEEIMGGGASRAAEKPASGRKAARRKAA